MEASLSTIAMTLVALGLGVLLGWLLGSRGTVAGRGVADALRLQLDAVRDERDGHARSIEALRGEHHELASRHAATAAAGDERARGYEARLVELAAAKEALGAQFAEVGGQLLERAQKQFLDRADQRFKESETTAGNSTRHCSSRSTTA